MKTRLHSFYLGFFVLSPLLFTSCDSGGSSTALNRPVVETLDNNNEETTFLTLVSNEKTGISFQNGIEETEYKNHKSYTQIYNGGGVAVGDLNNDGLPDLYFAGNSVKDKLYFNTGDFTFKDVTKEAGIEKYTVGWSYGVNMVDINADGYLDIYICKAGPYANKQYLRNRLLINNGDGTFTEDAASYGLNIDTYSVQSTFFDYDLDGDLDMYLLAHPIPGSDTADPASFAKYVSDINKGILRTDKFYENVDGKYVEKTDAAKLVNYGYKNAVGVGDFNKDGYPDLYVSTDFGEPDLYYVNNGNKTFSNKVRESLKHITYYSMGSEVSDVNNDGELDIYVTDMTPNDHVKSKVFMPSMDPAKFNAFVRYGFHHQYMLNSLQLNNGDNTFSEVGQLAGIAKTDWSWAPLFFDIDLDGKKDLFVTNGIKENLNDNDIKEKVFGKQDELGRTLSLQEYLELVPSDITPNQTFKNKGDLNFADTSTKWMDNANFNSNGAAYADLDGDGDLDLVLNNMDAIASVYENKSPAGKTGNSLVIKLKGPKNNPFGLGTKIDIPTKDGHIFHEHYPARGYLSSVDYNIVLGLGTMAIVPEIKITWADGKTQTLTNIATNQKLEIAYAGQSSTEGATAAPKTYLAKQDPRKSTLQYVHREDAIDDFKKQVLLPYSQSQNGPFMASGDVNGDGLEDLFVGGAAGSPGKLFTQTATGDFAAANDALWQSEAAYEDLGAVFFDADQDGDLDLYVTSGGAASAPGDALYRDRLYTNDGQGGFAKSMGKIPNTAVSTQVVLAQDVDSDGDLDLFVGGRVIPDKYPYAPKSSLLINNNGVFKDATASQAKQLERVGIVTGAVFSDYDSDGDKDLLVVGEWSPISVFDNNDGKFTLSDATNLEGSAGLWFSISESDVNADGKPDYFVGNLGLNSKFSAKKDKPFHVFCDDYDNNGTYDVVFSKDYKGKLVPMRGRECSSEQMPFILDKFKNYNSFANASLEDIIGQENLANGLHYQVESFKSICLVNNGDGTFTKVILPKMAQVSPIMDVVTTDLNADGTNEFIAVGNLYPTEVETTRYDASKGMVMQYNDGAFTLLPMKTTGLAVNGDAKDALVINTKKGKRLLVTNNNGLLEEYAINTP
ncbi:MAG: VCBS repeat-containing protein [Gilvibacter sp.]